MRRRLAAGMALIICCCPWQMGMAEEARALTPVPNKEPTFEVLDEVLVTGTRPGPALWQVKSGTNVLWILATPPLVSRDLRWQSPQMTRVLADIQEVLAQYGTGHIPKSAIPAEVRDGKGNLDSRKYRALVNQTRYFPEGQKLRDVLPPDVYASFEKASAEFPNGDKNLEKEGDLERARPAWARNLLGTRARQALHLEGLPVTGKIVSMAKRRRIKVTSVEYADWSGYIIPIPATIEAGMDMCPLDVLLQELEGRGARWKARANAWAVGNVKRMKELLRPLPTRIPQCDGREANGTEHSEKWLAAMERSLAENRGTLAVVDAALLLSAGGLLDELRRRGYEVIEP